MITDYGRAIQNIRQELHNYIDDNGIKALVLGVSGGIDSAICCALAKPVCDELRVPLIGRSITIASNKEDEKSRARAVGNFLCTDFNEVDLSDFNKSMIPHIMEDDASSEKDALQVKIRLGNIKARTRMIYIYDLAQASGGMVLSTDNYTELLAGFWTLHGDVGDYGMIQGLWKTEVYDIARYIIGNELISDEAKDALDKCIAANPTDGLGVSNSDLDQLGVKSYEEADKILIAYLGGDTSLEDHVLIERYNRTHFKRENPYNIPRETVLKYTEEVMV